MPDPYTVAVSAAKSLPKVKELITGALRKGREYRTETFIRTVETRYDQMTENQRIKFKETINSYEGQKIMADFAVAVAMTPSNIVNAALALLYAQDPEFEFTESQLERFVAAVSGLTDRKVEFYLRSFDTNRFRGEGLFSEHYIDKSSYEKISCYVDKDEIYIYKSDFVARGLFLEPPARFDAGSFREDGWNVIFGLSDTHKKYGALLRKAKEFMR